MKLRATRGGSRFAWVALLVAFAMVVAACGGDEGGDETTTTTAASTGADIEGPIWVLLPDSATSDRWENDDRRFFEEAFDAAGLTAGTDYTIVNAEGDSQTQLNQAEQAINDGASVVLFVEIDSGSGAAIIDTLRAAAVKVINYDRLTIEGPGADLYVSFDNVQVGRTMAEIMAPVIDGLEHLALLQRLPGPQGGGCREGAADQGAARADRYRQARAGGGGRTHRRAVRGPR